ncbi:MAG: aspartate carbamoyltransferase [Patescibacteria group bacterium]|jgi:aspartate carbamoyltransferase catalytic subunit
MPQHIIKTQNFTREFLLEFFNSVNEMKKMTQGKKADQLLIGRIVATLFYEESTRTRLSFEAAAMRLGATVISTASAKLFSSAAKGEILEDTIRVLDSYCDCIVLRYHEEGGAARAAHVSRVPIINGGDGSGQHPTQSLLDLFTIYDEIGNIDGLSVALVGDLKHGRTVHSLAYLLGKFDNITLYLIAPNNLTMPKEIIDYMGRHNVKFYQADDFCGIIDQIDVLYQTRIQRERFEIPEGYEASKGKLVVTRELANEMKTDSIILHPLPRVDEIRYGVDDNHRAKYFKQAENGLYTRMALLKMLLS